MTLIDRAEGLALFGCSAEEEDKALFCDCHEIMEEDNFTMATGRKYTQAQILRMVQENLQGIKTDELSTIDKHDRNEAIRRLRKSGLSIREIERTTGISRGIIENVFKS